MEAISTLVIVSVLLVAAASLTYAVSAFNGIVELRNNIDKAWSNIDVLLRQRHDEIFQLIEVCKGYMKFERETLESVVLLRSRFGEGKTSDEKAEMENEFNRRWRSLFSIQESYPDLKSNEHVLRIQSRISALESNIADRRELFNDSVNIYNIMIQRFPEILVAARLGFEPHSLLEVH